jgi:hypothetical protein
METLNFTSGINMNMYNYLFNLKSTMHFKKAVAANTRLWWLIDLFNLRWTIDRKRTGEEMVGFFIVHHLYILNPLSVFNIVRTVYVLTLQQYTLTPTRTPLSVLSTNKVSIFKLVISLNTDCYDMEDISRCVIIIISEILYHWIQYATVRYDSMEQT